MALSWIVVPGLPALSLSIQAPKLAVGVPRRLIQNCTRARLPVAVAVILNAINRFDPVRLCQVRPAASEGKNCSSLRWPLVYFSSPPSVISPARRVLSRLLSAKRDRSSRANFRPRPPLQSFCVKGTCWLPTLGLRWIALPPLPRINPHFEPLPSAACRLI